MQPLVVEERKNVKQRREKIQKRVFLCGTADALRGSSYRRGAQNVCHCMSFEINCDQRQPVKTSDESHAKQHMSRLVLRHKIMMQWLVLLRIMTMSS